MSYKSLYATFYIHPFTFMSCSCLPSQCELIGNVSVIVLKIKQKVPSTEKLQGTLAPVYLHNIKETFVYPYCS